MAERTFVYMICRTCGAIPFSCVAHCFDVEAQETAQKYEDRGFELRKGLLPETFAADAVKRCRCRERDGCPACGVAYADHLGLSDTCRDLQNARAEIKRLREGIEKEIATHDGYTAKGSVSHATIDRLGAVLKGAQNG